MVMFRKSLPALTNEDILYCEGIMETLLYSGMIYTNYKNGISDVSGMAQKRTEIDNAHVKALFHEITHEVKNYSQSVINVEILILNIPIKMTLILTPLSENDFSAVYAFNEKESMTNAYIEYQRKKINNLCSPVNLPVIKNRL